jgi:hypothetical protein
MANRQANGTELRGDYVSFIYDAMATFRSDSLDVYDDKYRARVELNKDGLFRGLKVEFLGNQHDNYKAFRIDEKPVGRFGILGHFFFGGSGVKYRPHTKVVVGDGCVLPLDDVVEGMGDEERYGLFFKLNVVHRLVGNRMRDFLIEEEPNRFTVGSMDELNRVAADARRRNPDLYRK